MPYVRCATCERVMHLVVWRVGRDACRSCGRPLLRAASPAPSLPEAPAPRSRPRRAGMTTETAITRPR